MPIVENIPAAKRSVLAQALDNPDREESKAIIQKATQRGWIVPEEKPDGSAQSLQPEMVETVKRGIAELPKPEILGAKKISGEGVGKGAAFMMGALESVNPLSFAETIGRAGVKIIKGENPFGALSEQPVTSIRGILETTPTGKKISENLPKDWGSYGGMAGMAVGLLKAIPAAAKGSVLRQAAKSEANVINKIKYLTGEAEGPVLQATVRRPEKVLELVKSGHLSPDELAVNLLSDIRVVQKRLGEEVGRFRKETLSNSSPVIASDLIQNDILALESSLRTTIMPEEVIRGGISFGTEIKGGKSILSKSQQGTLNDLRKLAEPEKIAPRDALLIVDKIDESIEYEKKLAGNIETKFTNALKDLRNQIKNKVREKSSDLKSWSAADDRYSKFVENIEGIPQRLESDQRASFVDNLLGKNKDPIRIRLQKAFDVGGDVDYADRFFDELANLKAAQGLKALDVTKADPIRDQINRVFVKWQKRGERVGAAVGAGIGAKIGGTPGALIGATTGGFAGRIAGEAMGRKAASPFTLLAQAQKAKILSREAKEFAKDLDWMSKKLGPDAANLMVNTFIGTVPAVNELSLWAKAQGE